MREKSGRTKEMKLLAALLAAVLALGTIGAGTGIRAQAVQSRGRSGGTVTAGDTKDGRGEDEKDAGAGSGAKSEKTAEERRREAAERAGLTGRGGGKKPEDGDGEPPFPLLDVYPREQYCFDEGYHTMLAIITFDEMHLAPESETEFPKLAESFRELAEYKDETYIEIYDDFLEEARGIWRDEDEETADALLPLRMKSTYYVRRADDAVVSFIEEFTLNGGGEEETFFLGWNYDAQTGETIGPEQAFGPYDETAELLADRILEDYDTSVKRKTLVTSIGQALDDEDVQWTMDPNGVTFWFDANTLEEDTGVPIVATLLYAEDEQEDFFPGIYGEQKAPWAMYFPEWYPACADLDLDGGPEFIRVFGGGPEDEDMVGWNDSVIVNVDGKAFTLDEHGYDVAPMLVKSGSKIVLYLQMTGAGDTDWIDCYDLMDGEPEYLRQVEGAPAGLLYDELGDYDFERYQHIPERKFTDMRAFRLREWIHVLDYVPAHRDYYLIRDGAPGPVDDAWIIDDSSEWSLAQELTGTLIDGESGEEAGPVTLRRGDVLRIYRTDGESWMDFITGDGRIVRTDIDVSDYPQLVNGIEVMELFEDIFVPN